MSRSTLSDIESCEVEKASSHLERSRCSGRSRAQGHSPAKVVPNQRSSDLGAATPVFDWLMGEASQVPDQVQFHDGHTDVCRERRLECFEGGDENVGDRRSKRPL